jgi:hypothetical protein
VRGCLVSSRSAASPVPRPERVLALGPDGRDKTLCHRAAGTYDDDGGAYWRELTEALSPRPYQGVGATRQEKQTQLTSAVAYVERQHKDIAA